VRQGEHDETDDRPRQAEHQHRAAAVAVRQIAEGGRRDQLTERERREQEADDDRRRAERLRIERQERDDDPEANEVDQNRQEDDKKRARHEAADILYNSAASMPGEARPAHFVPIEFPARAPLLSRTGA
jgi:hypothetical protein